MTKDSDPHWNESLAVAMPSKLKGCPAEELYIHVLLWDYDAINQDRLVGQAQSCDSHECMYVKEDAERDEMMRRSWHIENMGHFPRLF